VIENAAIAIGNGAVVAVGEWAGEAEQTIDAHGALVSPGLVDCHTHAVFGGDRAAEFALRAAGATYPDIAAAGGGIAATLGPTRAAIADGTIAETLRARLAAMRREGTTTVEIKTGYALTTAGELALLDAIGAAAAQVPVRCVPTLLAHLIPPDRRGDRAAFVAEICDAWIPRATSATSVDVWCEDGAFTLAEARAILLAAKRAGKAMRGHVGQLSDQGAAELLGELGALSADHVEQIGDAGIAALARAGTVAVMLPGACVQLRLPVPPVAALRAAKIPLAIATDFNPGSSWCEALPIQMWLATTHFQMSIEEAWLGVTRVAAHALGLGGSKIGTLAPGAPADLVIWKTDDPVHVAYRYGTSLVGTVITGGLTP
jgi:imidazolonepropionase